MVVHALLLTGLAALLAASPALAQIAPQARPYRGLFGGGYGDVAQSLNGTISLGGGYTGSFLASATSDISSVNRPNLGGAKFGSLSGGLLYALSGGRASLNGSAMTSLRYYRQSSDRWLHGSSGSVGLGFRASSRTSLTADLMVRYQPYNLLLAGLAPATSSSVTPATMDPADLSLNAALAHVEYLSWGASVSVAHQLARRVSAHAGYGAIGDNLSRSRRAHRGNAGMAFGLTRYLSARIGYGYETSMFRGPASGQRQVSQHIDAGLAFGKALSLTRKTSMSFSTGSSITRWGNHNHIHLTGSAALHHEAGRSWTTSVDYSRNVQYLAIFTDPALADAVRVRLSGMLGRRVGVTTGVHAVWWTVGFGGGDTRAFSAGASASGQYALSRHLGLSVQYGHYYHDIESGVSLLPGVPRESRYQTVSAHLSMWVPLMNRQRRP